MRRMRTPAARLPPSASRRPSPNSAWTARSSMPTKTSCVSRVIRSPRSRASVTRCSSTPRSARAANIARCGTRWPVANSTVGQYKRIGKGGREIWVQASYNPITDVSGKPFKVVEYATDITEQKMRNADFEGQLAAISKSQAVIEFDLDGTIRSVNDNFTSVMGYSNSRSSRQASQHVRRPGHQRWRGISRVLGQARPRRSRGRALQARRQGWPRSVVAGFLQPDPRHEWPSVQSGQVRHRRDRSRCRWRSSSS